MLHTAMHLKEALMHLKQSTTNYFSMLVFVNTRKAKPAVTHGLS